MDERYGRQVIMPEIGDAGQSRLAAAGALVVGAGGLGAPVLYALAAAGVGRIHIVDGDRVERSNLNRQFLHFERDIGRGKAESAQEKLQSFNSGIAVTSSAACLDESNVREAASGYDIVISCVDNQRTRLLLNACCTSLGIPLIDGGVNGFEGYILTMLPGVTPCYRCLFPDLPEAETPIPALAATAVSVGGIMAAQAVKVLLGIHEGAALLLLDLRSLIITPVAAQPRRDCPCCHGGGGGFMGV